MPGLYIHIPFCETKCIYCDFYSVETFDLYSRFIESCKHEIALRTDVLQPGMPFGSVFFGGGTPSLLTPEQLDDLLLALRSSFRLAADAEITVECNPGTISAEKFAAYRELGVNRLSIGVQSFFEDDLRFLSRIHTPEEAEDALRFARDAGFENTNIDLMFSLPGQTPERWLHNLRRAKELESKHFSCYSLTVESGTPLAGMQRRGLVALPSQDSDAGLFETTMETLEGWGYRQYEVSNYALEGYVCRHNLTYWRHEDYLGFGPSAHSTWKKRRWWNAANVDLYIERMEESRFPEAGSEQLTPEILRQEFIYLRLRSEGIDMGEFRRRFAADFKAENFELLRRYEDNGLLRTEGDILRLTPEGFLLCDEMCTKLK